jgi:hypothetical protein
MGYMKYIDLHRVLVGAVLLGAGTIIGAAVSTSNVARGEVRAGAPPAAFQSGGQLSVPVLKEIASTLHQIDSRLARLETAAQKLQTQGAGAAK